MTQECHVRICGSLGGKLPEATRHPQVEPLLATRILGLGWDHERREIQHIHHTEQVKHVVVN
jgi:hypothetical protein